MSDRYLSTRPLTAAVLTLTLMAALPVSGAAHGDEGETAVTGSVWVADEYSDSLSVIDAATNEPVTTLTGITGPHNLQVAPDGASVWTVSGHDSLGVMIDAAAYRVHGVVPDEERARAHHRLP